MDYRIVEKEAYTVFGKSITIGLDEDHFGVVPKFWQDFQEDGTYQRICRTAGFEPYSGKLLSAAAYDFNSEAYKFKYIIHTELPPGVEVPSDLDVVEIPAAEWAVFSATFDDGADATSIIQNLWKRVFTEWSQCPSSKPRRDPSWKSITKMRLRFGSRWSINSHQGVAISISPHTRALRRT